MGADFPVWTQCDTCESRKPGGLNTAGTYSSRPINDELQNAQKVIASGYSHSLIDPSKGGAGSCCSRVVVASTPLGALLLQQVRCHPILGRWRHPETGQLNARLLDRRFLRVCRPERRSPPLEVPYWPAWFESSSSAPEKRRMASSGVAKGLKSSPASMIACRRNVV